MTGAEVWLSVALVFFVIVAVGLAFRAATFEKRMLQLGVVLGAAAIDYGNGKLLVSQAAFDQFERDHTVRAEALSVGGMLITAEAG